MKESPKGRLKPTQDLYLNLILAGVVFIAVLTQTDTRFVFKQLYRISHMGQYKLKPTQDLYLNPIFNVSNFILPPSNRHKICT